jgi:hypothetical protein
MCGGMQKNYFYNVYGLGIDSTLALPELVAGEAASDVVLLRMGKVQQLPPLMDGTGIGFCANPDEACYWFEGVGVFLIRKGSEVIIDPAPGVEDRVLRLPILGPVLTVLMHQRGRLVLHASAIEAAGEAVAFMGASGQGKSTLAAVLESRGYAIVADDKTALDVTGSSCMVFPDCPRLKLWPDSIGYLGETPEDLPQLHPLCEKRSRPLTRDFAQRPLPLRCIYLLSRGATPAIELCRPQEALSEIMRNWAGARFGEELLRVSNIASFFLQCATLTKKIAVYRLRRPASLAALSQVVDLVEEHLAGGLQPAAD